MLTLSACIAAGVVQLAYWLGLRRGFRQARQDAAQAAATPPISVVVAARNEERALPALLQALAQQTHPQYEVVVVDDASTDGTASLVRTWAEQHPNVRLVQVEAPRAPRKKHALTLGVKASSHDLLTFTDADCVPPDGWLHALAQQHAVRPGETLCVGYSPYYRQPGLLNKLASYETFVTGFLTAAAIGLGRPYMAVGRNLSYSKTLFHRIGGFAHSQHSLSGDDDLLVQEVARRKAATVRHAFDPQTFVRTDAPPTWRTWFRQKRRHTSAGRFYPRDVQRHLALFQGTSLLLWGAPLLVGWTGLGLLAGKLLLQGLVLREAANVFRERRLLPALPLLDLLYAGYNLLVAPFGLVRVPEKW